MGFVFQNLESFQPKKAPLIIGIIPLRNPTEETEYGRKHLFLKKISFGDIFDSRRQTRHSNVCGKLPGNKSFLTVGTQNI